MQVLTKIVYHLCIVHEGVCSWAFEFLKSALYSLRYLTLTKTCNLLRNLKNLNKMTKNLEILPAENNVLFKFKFLRLYKVDFKNSKAYE